MPFVLILSPPQTPHSSTMNENWSTWRHCLRPTEHIVVSSAARHSRAWGTSRNTSRYVLRKSDIIVIFITFREPPPFIVRQNLKGDKMTTAATTHPLRDFIIILGRLYTKSHNLMVIPSPKIKASLPPPFLQQQKRRGGAKILFCHSNGRLKCHLVVH